MINFDSKICHVTFSHTDCKDIWPAYFGETKKYFKTNMKHFLCVNKVIDEIPSDITPIVYDQSKPYPERLHFCLDQLKDYDFIFFDHEDMFLYAEPQSSVLEQYYQVMKSGQLDHIRLIKGGMHFATKLDSAPTLFKFSMFSKWIFSIQPSFWNRKTLMDVLKANIDCNIWDLERRSQKVVRKMKLKAAYSQSYPTKRRGWFHYDNQIYPFIATAIGKGKWNYSEYKSELDKVFKEYNIDPNRRGIN